MAEETSRRIKTTALLLHLAAFWPAGVWLANRTYYGGITTWSLISAVTAVWFLWTAKGGKAVHPAVPLLGVLGFLLLLPRVPPAASSLAAMMVLGISLCRLRTGRYLHLGILGLLALSLPLEHTINFFAGYPLRLLSTMGAVPLIELAGQTLTREGTTLRWAGESIIVDVPCSGIRMLTAGLYVCGFLLCYRPMNLLRSLGFGLVCLFVLIAANAVRVAFLFFPQAGLLKLPDFAHALTGTILFMLALALTAAAARWFENPTPKALPACPTD